MLKRSSTNRQRGETLIELLLAFAILSMALVTVMRTMNGGLDSLAVNGQRSQVEAQMRGQLAILQAAHQQAIKEPGAADWAEITSKIASSDSFKQKDVSPGGCSYTADKNRLYFTTGDNSSWTGDVELKSTGTLTPVFDSPSPDGASMWIEAKHTPKSETALSRGFYDFYVKSCWQGGGGIKQEAKMVTRLYDTTATTTSPIYNNLVLTARDTSCANGANGKLEYTIRNQNTYPFGDVDVTITNGFYKRHTNVGPGAVITDPTPSGFTPADYTVRATVVATGDFKEVTVRILECPPGPIDIAGISGVCAPLYDFEHDERYVGRPGYGFMSNPGPYPYPCRAIGARGIYTCVNYDARYNSGITRSGSYLLRLSYYDANCGDGSVETLSVAGYNYRVEIYVNGVHDGSMFLPPGAPILTSVYYFNRQLNAGDQVGVRWWNNRFIDPSMRDPDFVIHNLRLEWR